MSPNVVVAFQTAQFRRGGTRPKIGLVHVSLVGYIASVPLLSGADSTAKLSQGLGVLLAGTFALLVLVNRRSIRVPTELGLFACFLGYVSLGGFLAKEPGVVVTRLITLCQLWILSVVVFNLLSTRRNAHFLGWKAYVAGVLLAAVLSVVMSGGSVAGRFAGTFENPNTYGLVLVIAIGALLLLPADNKIMVAARVGALGLFLWQIAMTGSRKAILAVIVLLAVYALTILKRNSRRPLRAMALILIFSILGVAFLGWLQTTPYWKRVENLVLFLQGEDVAEGSVYARADFIVAGLALWGEHPLFGLGADQYRFHVPELGLRETYSHSNPIEMLANFGLIGFVLYYGIYARLTFRLWSAWKRNRHSSTTRGLIFMASALWLTWIALEVARVSYLSKSHWILFSLLLAMSYSLEYTEDAVPSSEDVMCNDVRGGRAVLKHPWPAN